MTTAAQPTGGWDDDDVLDHAEQVAVARTQSRAQAARVASLSLPQARLFVRRLWEHAGTVDQGAPRLVVEAPLAHDVSVLLDRLGIASSRSDDDSLVRVSVAAADDRARFLREVVLARRTEAAFGAPHAPGAADQVAATLWSRARLVRDHRPRSRV